MYIQLTTEKEQVITIMASAILYFEDIVYPEAEEEDENEELPPRPKAKIVLQGHGFNVQETSADIRAFLDDLDT